MKSLIYITNNCYKNSSLTFAIELILWEIDSFEIFDLQRARLLLKIFILEVRVREYHDDFKITREIYQD